MKKNYPKISIITPSYNQGEYIERTIKSVLDQNYPNLEFIVMDGGSTDKTVSVLKKYHKHLIWKSEKDKGQADAINKGLRIATGDIVAYLNSDDTYEPHTLMTIATFFKKHPKASFVYGQGALIDMEDNLIGMYNTLPENRERLFASCGISQPTAFWKHELLQTVGYFNASYQYTMDYEYWVRVAQKYTLHMLPETLASTRIHTEAKTSKFTHKLHGEAIKMSQHHYGKVHYDWVFTFTDSAYEGEKNTPTYFRFMCINSLLNYIKWNHSLPPKQGMRIILSWLAKAL